jgi:hypothetical protein
MRRIIWFLFGALFFLHHVNAIPADNAPPGSVAGTAPDPAAMTASFKAGRIKKAWAYTMLYTFAIKGANSMISQLTDDDLGTLTGVNIRAHHFRFDLGLSKRIQLQNLFFAQKELSNSGQYPNFFVPVNAYTPRLYRFQEQILKCKIAWKPHYY